MKRSMQHNDKIGDKERARVTGGDRNYNAAPAAAASTWSLGERSETE